MKARRSVLSSLVLSLTVGLAGCMSDNTNAEHTHENTSPAGVWFISSIISDTTNAAGEVIQTQQTGRQLVVLEETGGNTFKLHNCQSGDMHLSLNRDTSSFHGAVSFTDNDALKPYNESEVIHIAVDEDHLTGTLQRFDRNLDGSWDSHQQGYFEGHKVSSAQTLEALSREEISALLGETHNYASEDKILGQTCAAFARISTTGTQNTVAASDVLELLTPEPQPDVMIASGNTP
ncbi:hypothetical protein [Thalassolituus maritimus]|uniref:Lipoprotein n=1 Tax=Thalassolituus maritimus TaxID=484498 RepID=A0ABP9ZXL4_9GAMM